MSTKSTIADFNAHTRKNGQFLSLKGGKYNIFIELEAQIHKRIDKSTHRTVALKESDNNRVVRFYEKLYGKDATMEQYVVFTQLDPDNTNTKIRLVIPTESISVLKDIMDKKPFSVSEHPKIRFERKIVLGTKDSIDEYPLDMASLRLSKEEFPDLSKEGVQDLRSFVDQIISPTKTRPVLFKIVNRRKYNVSPGIALFISQEFKSDQSMDDASLQMSMVSASKALPLYGIEVEIVDLNKFEDTSIEAIQERLFSEVYRAIAVLQGDQIPRKLSLFKEDLAFLNGGLSNWKSMFAAVKTMTRNVLIKMKTGDKDIAYAVSPKADGVTAAVIINPYGMVYIYDIVSENLLVTNMIGSDFIAGSILEGEYIAKDNKVLLYDVLIHNTRDLREETYFNRVALLDKIMEKTKISYHSDYYGSKFTMEKKDIFIPPSDLSVIEQNAETFSKVRTMMQPNMYEFETDGVIFTGNVSYPKSKNVSRRINAEYIIKYKPLEDTTVDFLIRYEKNSSGIAVIERINEIDYRRISFYVYKRTRGNIRTEAVRVYQELFPVNSRGFYETKDSKNEIKDDSIVEARYDVTSKSWDIVRIREDKTDRYHIFGLRERTANAVTTYESTIAVVEDPISIDELEQSAAYYAVANSDFGKVVRKVNNSIKRVLIESAIGFIGDSHGEITDSRKISYPGPWIIDFSVGQGGDLMKYTGAEYVFAMDIDPGNLITAKSRTESLRIKNVAFIRGDATKSIKTLAAFDEKDHTAALEKYSRDPEFSLKRTPSGLYDIGILNFTLTHFFESQKTLEGFLANAKHTIRPGGLLVITTIDGSEVSKTIGGSRTPIVSRSEFWSFWDSEGNTTKKSKYGRKYKYRIKSISDSYYEEYITDIPEFLKKAKEFGFTPASEVLNVPVSSFDSLDSGLLEDLPEDTQKYIEKVEHLEESELSDERFFAMHKYIVLINNE